MKENRRRKSRDTVPLIFEGINKFESKASQADSKVVSKCKALPCFSNVNNIETKVKRSFGPPVISISNQNKTAVLH